jgi:hypothetical protein
MSVKKLKKVESYLGELDALFAERTLEAVVGHVYAASAGDPNDIYFQDPEFVKRHVFRSEKKGGRESFRSFAVTTLCELQKGQGSVVCGSLAGLPDALGLLHAEQITYRLESRLMNEQIRSGLIGPVRRMSPSRLDDDALRFVDASCRATEELVAALADRPEKERARVWSEVAHDLVPRSRLGLLAAGGSGDIVRSALSPSDLFQVGRRLALSRPASVPTLPAAEAAKRAWDALVSRYGEARARERLAEFGPRAITYAGRFRLTDLALPAYERLSAYRFPQLFCDRLYDPKIAVARRVAESGLPASVLPVILPPAIDEILSRLRMAHAYDWSSIVRSAEGFTPADVERLMDDALRAGRVMRDEEQEVTAR